MPTATRPTALLALLVLVIAGCVSPAAVKPSSTTAMLPDVDGVVHVATSAVSNFTKSVVAPAVSTTNDLYEPTIEVSDTGAIYVAGHVAGAITTGSPAYVSNDHGKTWTQLPFAQSVGAPSPVQGATPPPGDEGVIVAGEKGQAWMADVYLYGYSVTGWCDNGKTQCYDDRQAYDRVTSTTTQCPNAGPTGNLPTTAASLNDRPWAAFTSGAVIMVNNAGGGPLQLGVLKVPPPTPIGVMGVDGPQWNTCASPGGAIPSSISARADGLFAATQGFGSGSSSVMHVTVGNVKDITKVATATAFAFTSVGDGTINGASAFDKNGTLFVTARNNTLDKPATPGGLPLVGGGSSATVKDGRFILAASTDDGKTFKNATFSVGPAVQTVMLDSNPHGDGVLLVWSQATKDAGASDWYTAHAFVDKDGVPTLRDVTLALAHGPKFYGDVMGCALGPDGRAYFVTMDRAQAKPGGTPLAVMMQQDGPTI